MVRAAQVALPSRAVKDRNHVPHFMSRRLERPAQKLADVFLVSVGVSVSVNALDAHAMPQGRLPVDKVPPLPRPEVGGRQSEQRDRVVGQPGFEDLVENVGAEELGDFFSVAGPPGRMNPSGGVRDDFFAEGFERFCGHGVVETQEGLGEFAVFLAMVSSGFP